MIVQTFKPSENGLWDFRSEVGGIWGTPSSAEYLWLDLHNVDCVQCYIQSQLEHVGSTQLL
jgi:hypothetical protein